MELVAPLSSWPGGTTPCSPIGSFHNLSRWFRRSYHTEGVCSIMPKLRYQGSPARMAMAAAALVQDAPQPVRHGVGWHGLQCGGHGAHHRNTELRPGHVDQGCVNPAPG